MRLLKLFVVIIACVLTLQPVLAKEYNTLSVTMGEYEKYNKIKKAPFAHLLKYNDNELNKYTDVGNGYKINNGGEYLNVLKFDGDKLLWSKYFFHGRPNSVLGGLSTAFKSAYVDNNGNLVIWMENCGGGEYYYLTKKYFTVNKHGTLITKLEVLNPRLLNNIENPAWNNHFYIFNNFDFEGKHYYIVGYCIMNYGFLTYTPPEVSRVKYSIHRFEDENGKLILKGVKYLFSKKQVDNISIKSFPDRVVISFDDKKFTLTANELTSFGINGEINTDINRPIDNEEYNYGEHTIFLGTVRKILRMKITRS